VIARQVAAKGKSGTNLEASLRFIVSPYSACRVAGAAAMSTMGAAFGSETKVGGTGDTGAALSAEPARARSMVTLLRSLLLCAAAFLTACSGVSPGRITCFPALSRGGGLTFDAPYAGEPSRKTLALGISWLNKRFP
jgi:hypothetical protein